MHLSPIMIVFTKNKETLSRFSVELISPNPQLINLRKVGAEMETSVLNGFQSIICKLLPLYCAQHLHQRDKKRTDNYHRRVP